MRRYIGLDVLAKARMRLVQPDMTDASDEEVTLPAITA
jgi:hypothetical protein